LSLLVWDDDLTIARVHHEDGKQLCRFSGAGILADPMASTRLPVGGDRLQDSGYFRAKQCSARLQSPRAPSA